MIRSNILKSLAVFFIVIPSIVVAQEISQKKMKNRYKVIYVSQRDLNNNYLAFSNFESIITNLTHKTKLGVESTTLIRTDNDKKKIFVGKEISMSDPIFTETMSTNNCDANFTDWFYCVAKKYNFNTENIFILNTANNITANVVEYNSKLIPVYFDGKKLYEDINQITKGFAKSTEDKSIIILHYQDDDIDPCINLKLKIENYRNSLKPEILNVFQGKRLRAVPVAQFKKNYFEVKCNHITDFEGYEIIISTKELIDIKLTFLISDSGSINYNEHFCQVDKNQIYFYISEYLIADYITKNFDGELESDENYTDLLYKWKWDISIRGFGGPDCPDVFGPVSTVSKFMFSCH